MIIAIIPAKSDSKRLPDKNMQLLDGKPLLWYAIEYAKRSKLIDEIYVSTDSRTIADYAKEKGVKIIMRDESLCGEASVMQVYVHAFKIIGQRVNYIVGVQPDHPGRKLDVDNTLRSMMDKNYELLLTMDKNGIANGSLKIMSREVLITGKPENISTLLCEIDDCINIHTEEDLKKAELEIQNTPLPFRLFGHPRPKHKILITAPTRFMPDIEDVFQEKNSVCFAYNQPKELFLSSFSESFDVLIPNPCDSYRIDNDFLKHFSSIKTIITPSTGTNHIDVDYCKQQGIKILGLLDDRNSLESISASAEYTFGLMMALIRNIPQSVESVKAGHWREVEDSFRGIELQGKTISIIGCGRIGRKLSSYLRPFNPKQIFKYDKNWNEDCPELILGKSDIVFICLGLNKETHGMIDASWFDMMKDGVYLINTSRGEIINEDALIKSLKSGKVKAAAVDVVCNETEFANNKLIQYSKEHEYLIVTPHIAGLTVESQRKAMLSVIGLLERNS